MVILVLSKILPREDSDFAQSDQSLSYVLSFLHRDSED